MKSLSTLSLALLIAALAACAPGITPAPPTQTAPASAALPAATPTAPLVTLPPPLTPLACALEEFDSRCAYEHARMLAVTIGTRVAGTPASVRTADYIADHFARFGYSVERQAFTFEPWEDLGTKIRITMPATRDLEAQAIQFSVAGHLEAEVVAVGGVGDTNDLASVDVKGKIALVQRGTLQFYDKSKNAAEAGAVAILIYNNQPQLFGGTMRERSTIPTIALSGRDGQSMLDALRQGAVKVRLDSDTQVLKRTGHNIIATKRGTSDRAIVTGGHYDSVANTPGANDNASGTAVILELARVLSRRETNSTLIFIAFDAEEFGLLGSEHYVRQLSSSDRSRIVAMLNFDMLGGGIGPLGLGGDGSVALAARRAASELGIESRNFRLGPNSGSDHAPFMRAGIDVIFFSRDYDLLHTPQDSLEQIREQFLGEAGRVAVKSVLALDAR